MSTKNDAISLANDLLDIPTQISDKQKVIVADNTSLSEIETEIALVENEIKQEINETVDTSGKKMYPNADARDAAFLAIKQNHAVLNDKYSTREEVRRRIQLDKIEVERLVNHQRNLRSIIGLFSGIAEEA